MSPIRLESALPAAWDIAALDEIADGIGGRVFRAALRSGGTAIVKQLSALALRDRADGEAFLRWRDGRGAVRLLDRQGDLLLLEDAGDRTLLDLFRRDGDKAAAGVAAELIRVLHASGAGRLPAGLDTLDACFSSLFARAAMGGRGRDAEHYRTAAALAERLLAGQRGIRPLHGDFHHENALHSPRGWLAIDPKGVLGDPAFDVANLFYNPLESELRYDPARAARLACGLAPAVDRKPAELLDWAFAFTALSASWHAEDGNLDEAAKSLRVGRAVATARERVA